MPLAYDTEPSSSSLLIKISRAALNPADAHFMGVLPTFLPWRRRPVPCFDFVGTVVKAGPLAPTHLRPGTAVCGAFAPADVFVGKGALAEYATIPADRVALVPEVLKGERVREAAGLGIAGQTAVLMLRTAKIEDGNWKGMRVMVIGASGGVGSLLVQVLSAWGVHVVGVSSGANAEFITKLGVAEVGLQH
jgi:NADPH:quinone reductase-like Zn-dependent oxidoreductase